MTIEELLLHWENRLGCSLSLEPIHELFRQSPRLSFPNHRTLHNHDYCRFIKGRDRNHSCAVNKHRTLRLARHGRPFGGCCPYGVWEWVQPILFHGELAAVLYLGTYAKGDHSRWRQMSRHYTGAPLPPFSPEKVAALQAAGRFFAQFLTYELQLAEEAFLADAKQHVKQRYCGIVKNLIALRYRENLHLQEVAEACQVTPNYLSALLKSVTGKTFKELLTEQRLVEAEACLKYRNLSIAEIAAQCGFQDSNYFSVVFRKYFGASPSEYRLSWGMREPRGASVPQEEGEE